MHLHWNHPAGEGTKMTTVPRVKVGPRLCRYQENLCKIEKEWESTPTNMGAFFFYNRPSSGDHL